jgi:hypothetical protein
VRKAPIHSFARLAVNILPSRTIASRPQKEESDFKYKAVSLDRKEKEIRLLTLEPGEWSETISGTLSSFTLDNVPSYDALSYVWGNPAFTKNILLDGYAFPVTINLECALRYLRPPRRSSREPRVIWIDAICIDQQNLEERSSQILLMRQVFQSAKTVLVWLGEATNQSRAAFQLIQKASLGIDKDLERYVYRDFWSVLPRPLPILLREESSRVGLNGVILDLSPRPWWTHVWVIQETAVSSKVLIICGHDVMRWERFPKHYGQSSLAPDLSGPSTESLVLFKRRLNIHMFISRSGTRSLADLVANIRIMTATDPKDMVYAILGLADNAWADQSRHPVALPDYSPLTSVLDVYQDLVEHAIANGSLDIICMQRLYDRLEDGTWPSSVPDWSSSGVGTHSLKGNYHGFNMVERGCLINKALIEKYNGLKELNAGLRANGSWRAAGESLPIARVTKSPPVLHTTGIFVDSISELGNAFEFGDFGLLLCNFSSWDELILNTLGARSNSHEQSETDAFAVLDECHKFVFLRV